MRVTIDNVTSGAGGIWTAHIDPQSLLRLASPVRQESGVSVVLVRGSSYDAENGCLMFDLESSITLNLGNTSEVIMIDCQNRQHKFINNTQTNTSPINSGDQLFIKELMTLPVSQQTIGRTLLNQVRSKFPGELKYHEKSKKFVESPDNFWVVRIQPRARSLRIVVYGRPNEHGTQHTLTMKGDMPAYTCFTIDNELQLPEAIKAIFNAKRLKDSK